MLRTARLSAFGLMVLCSSLAATVAGATSGAPIELRLANGIQATIYSPDYIAENMTLRMGAETLFVVDDYRYHFVTDVHDPIVANPGDGTFHPMSVDMVIEALEDIDMPDMSLSMRVYVLPFPRREVLDSSARGDMMFLSPGVREVSDYAVHFTVTHEVGHIFQYRWMPDEDARMWARYAHLRGIQNAGVFNAAASHRNRPHEVFAEDFRFLFGGEQSTYSGSIENSDLRLPDAVDGLDEFIASLTSVRPLQLARIESAPNPFNPATEIQVEFVEDPGPGIAIVRVFDAQGRQVRRLYEGPVSTRALNLRWDGRHENGQRAATGVYFARLDYAGERITTKLTLVK